MAWRILRESLSPAENMALDEVLLTSARTEPVLRSYRWREPAVTISRTQDANDIAHICPIVRRFSGGPNRGRALYHEAGDLTYTIAAPEALLPAFGNERETYMHIYRGLQRFFLDLGVTTEAKEVGRGTVLWNGAKISGNSQARADGVFYQHGSIFAAGTAAYRAGILSQLHGTNIPETAIAILPTAPNLEDRLVDAFRTEFGGEWVESRLTREEQERVRELVETRYETDVWTNSGTDRRGSCEASRWTT